VVAGSRSAFLSAPVPICTVEGGEAVPKKFNQENMNAVKT